MTLPTRGSVPSPIIIPVTFRLRLEQNTEHAHHAYRHLRGRLPCAVKQFRPHRASEYALHLSGTDIGLLGVLLEGLSGNRHRFPHQEPSHNRSPAVLRLISGHVLVHCPFREPMPPANVCHLSAAGTPTASWPSAQSGANASCGYLPPQRRRYSNRVLVQCPVGLPMPPAAVCHLSAADTPTSSWSSASRLANATSVLRKGRRPKTISRRDVSPRPRRRRGSLRSGAQPSSPAPFRRE